MDVTAIITAIKDATNNVESMTDKELSQLSTVACFLTAAISTEKRGR